MLLSLNGGECSQSCEIASDSSAGTGVTLLTSDLLSHLLKVAFSP